MGIRSFAAELLLPAVLQAKHRNTAPAAGAKDEVATFAALQDKLGYLSKAEVKQIREAYKFADGAHLGQFRASGEPYITHPLAVAGLVADWRLDAQALMAALMHDAMEDCGITKVELIEKFGAPTAELVDGLTKLDKLQFSTREEGQAESFRKMLLAMARDVRVILVKLADRLHNMRTMTAMPANKRGRIARETLDIYAPIAHRLGLNMIYRELQELSFEHLYPWRHAALAKAVQRARGYRRDIVERVRAEVDKGFALHKMKVQVSGREKTVYSIYRKMREKHAGFAQVNDIFGFRIVVPQLMDCYLALGMLHQLYKPVPGRFKDYIAIPKINGYQSLHTTLVGPASINVEFQIRTEAMDLVAEAGVAAHWLYKSGEHGHLHGEQLGNQWLQSLLDIQNETRDAAEFWDNVKVDLFPDAVYVFTPKGQILALPRGATVVDFAYAIHSTVGDHTVAAKVNGEQVPLRTEVTNGDVVEVVTAPVSSPNPAWLGFVRTGRARSKIRSHLKSLAQDQSRTLGDKLLAQALRAEGVGQPPGNGPESKPTWDKLLRFTGNRSRDELLLDIGLGKRSASMVAKRLATLLGEQGVKPDALLLTRARYTAHENLSQGAVTVDGSADVSIKYATCCRPIPGDGLLGYLGRGEGLVVHTDECAVARRLQHKDPERFITVAWADEPVRAFEVGVVVTVVNGKGVLARVAAAIASAESDIVHLGMPDEVAQDALDLRFVITVRDRTHLEHVLRTLRWTQSVLRATRTVPTSS